MHEEALVVSAVTTCSRALVVVLVLVFVTLLAAPVVACLCCWLQ